MRNEKSKRKIIVIISVIITMLIALLTCYFVFSNKEIHLVGKSKEEKSVKEKSLSEKVEPLWENMEIELGTEIEQDITKYIQGDEEAIEVATLDFSQVNKDEVGNYKIYVKIEKRTIAYDINIIDTVAPEFDFKEDRIYLELGKEYQADDLIDNVYDLSGDVKAYFALSESPSIKYDEMGEYKLSVAVEDVSGNKTTKLTSVIVDSAPQLIGIRDISIKKSTEFDFSNGVIAVDKLDGNITENIVIDTSQVDFATVGTYNITYTVEDKYGIKTSKTAVVTVCDEEPIKNILDNSLTKEEMAILCNYDHFKYDVLEEENYDEAIKLVEPTLISIYSSRNSGAGYIYKITPEYVYVLTEKHVMTKKEDYTFVFYDKSTVQVSYNERISLNTNKDYKTNTSEIVLYRINVSDISKETMVKLKQANYNPDKTPYMYVGQKLFVYTKWYKMCAREDLIKKVTVTNTFAYFEYQGVQVTLETTKGCISGQSGSPTYDYKGNLVGMIYGGFEDKNYHLFIDELKNFDSRLDEFNDFD